VACPPAIPNAGIDQTLAGHNETGAVNSAAAAGQGESVEDARPLAGHVCGPSVLIGLLMAFVVLEEGYRPLNVRDGYPSALILPLNTLHVNYIRA
jgi:hypothetical protein